VCITIGQNPEQCYSDDKVSHSRTVDQGNVTISAGRGNQQAACDPAVFSIQVQGIPDGAAVPYKPQAANVVVNFALSATCSYYTWNGSAQVTGSVFSYAATRIEGDLTTSGFTSSDTYPCGGTGTCDGPPVDQMRIRFNVTP
jgi:hypothetical protein